MNPARELSELELAEAIASWRSQGFAVIRDVADTATCAALRDRLTAYIDGTHNDPGLFFQRDAGTGDYADVGFGQGYEGPNVPYRKIEKLERDDRYLAWLSDPLFQRLAALIFPGSVSLYRATAFIKAAKVGSNLPWHQDGGRFWGLDRDPCFQVWTALDDAPLEAGCLQFVPGSHHRGLASPMGGLVPAEAAVGLEDLVVSVPARAGDVVLVHNLVWHRSGPNITSFPRRAFSVSYLDGQTKCLRKKRAPRVFPQVFRAG